MGTFSTKSSSLNFDHKKNVNTRAKSMRLCLSTIAHASSVFCTAYMYTKLALLSSNDVALFVWLISHSCVR